MRFIDVPYGPIPPSATAKERLELYQDYRRRLATANPRIYWSDGRPKKFWQSFKEIFFMKASQIIKEGFYWYASEFTGDPLEVVCVDRHEFEDLGCTVVWFEVFGARTEVGTHYLNCLGDFYGPIEPPDFNENGAL